MRDSVRWICISGDELLDGLHESSLSTIVPRVSGIYIWRRRILYDPNIASTEERCTSWVRQLASQPMGKISEKDLSHCVKMNGMTVGGGGLTSDKELSLKQAAKNRAMRDRMLQVIGTLNNYMPPIYIGETNDLCKRAYEHLNGDTNLQDYIWNCLNVDWIDLELHFLQLSRSNKVSSEARRYQELLEFLAQRILSPFGTERPG